MTTAAQVGLCALLALGSGCVQRPAYSTRPAPAATTRTPAPPQSDASPRNGNPSRRPRTSGARELRFSVATDPSPLGREPGLRLSAGDAFPPNTEFDVDVILTTPSGREFVAPLHLGPTEATAYCLPAKGRRCKHDRRVSQFRRADLRFGVPGEAFATVGVYRLDLVDPSRRVGADTLEFEIVDNRTPDAVSPAVSP